MMTNLKTSKLNCFEGTNFVAAEAVEAFGFVQQLGGAVAAFHVYEVGRANLFTAGAGTTFMGTKVGCFYKNFFCKIVNPLWQHFAKCW